jgi:(p)ppGpp synthase/HD superfamily hydrolase
LSADAIAIAWLHDVLEDNLDVTAWEVYCLFGPLYGPKIVDGVIALTQREWMSEAVYFGRIEVASSVNWEVAVVKLIDRWHFHSDSYNGPVKKELAKIDQTQKIFQQTIRNCAVLVPEYFQPKYNQLLNEVLELAETRQAILTAA